MGTPLPFLPFSGEKEYKAYAKFVAETDPRILKDVDAAAIAWCNHVDGIDVMPKIPSHLRTHDEEWNKNQRVKDSVSRAASRNEMLEKLNKKISPTHEREADISNEDDAHIAPPQSFHNVEQHSRTSARLMIDTLRQPSACFQWNNQIMTVPMFPVPQPQALLHTLQPMIIGGFSIGKATANEEGGTCGHQTKKRGRKPGSKNKGPRAHQPCGRCKDNNGKHKDQCHGRGRNGRKGCEYFINDVGDRKQCGKCNNSTHLCHGGENGTNCCYM